MNRSISDIVVVEISHACGDINTPFTDDTDVSDVFFNIWSGITILSNLHVPQFPTKNPSWLKNIE